VARKREVEGRWALGEVAGKEDGEVLVRMGSFACCFSLALLLEVAMFELFQCFLTFQLFPSSFPDPSISGRWW
jgi:hypothetical protein